MERCYTLLQEHWTKKNSLQNFRKAMGDVLKILETKFLNFIGDFLLYFLRERGFYAQRFSVMDDGACKQFQFVVLLLYINV